MKCKKCEDNNNLKVIVVRKLTYSFHNKSSMKKEDNREVMGWTKNGSLLPEEDEFDLSESFVYCPKCGYHEHNHPFLPDLIRDETFSV